MLEFSKPEFYRRTGWRSLRPSCSSAKRQRGQALPLGIAFIMVGFVGAFVLFNTGQVAINKQRLSDAADSAAYSGMVWQARALNFQAYTNRAMIANDVSIGQAVSLNSWANYAELASNNIAQVLSVVPLLNVFANAAAQVLTYIRIVVDPVTDAMVTAVDMINTVIELSQEAMFASAFIATPDIVHQVAKASHPEFEDVSAYAVGGAVLNLNSWRTFTEKYEQTDKDAMRERTNLITESRDDFSAKRGWRFFENFWLFFPSPFTKHRLYYNGNTQLLMNDSGGGEPNWEWVAKDALSHHVKTYRFSGFRLKSTTVEIPFGWASSYANSDGGSTKTIEGSRQSCKDYTTVSGDPCKFLANNGKGEDFANVGLVGLRGTSSGPNKLSGYTGVKAFRSLSQSTLDEDITNGDPVLRLRTEISMDMDKNESSNDWVHDSEPFATEIVSAGNKMSSISIGEVYYRHPKAYVTTKRNIALQRANGYNPYWDVRLAPVDLKERLVALGLREGFIGGSSSPVSPGAAQLASYAEDDGFPDFEPGASLSDPLGAAGVLATQMGLDDAVKDGVRAEIDNLMGTDFSAAALEAFESIDGVDIDTIETQIKDELKQALEDVVKDLLMSAVSSATGISDGQIAAAETEAERILGEAEAIIDDMEAMKAAVKADMEAIFLAEIPPYELEVADIRLIIGGLKTELAILQADIDGREHASDGPVGARDRVLAEIAMHRQRIVQKTKDLKELITDNMADSLLRHGADMFPDGMSGEFRDYLAKDMGDMVTEYLAMTDEERIEAQLDNPLEMEDDDEALVVETYDEDDYGKFEE